METKKHESYKINLNIPKWAPGACIALIAWFALFPTTLPLMVKNMFRVLPIASGVLVWVFTNRAVKKKKITDKQQQVAYLVTIGLGYLANWIFSDSRLYIINRAGHSGENLQNICRALLILIVITWIVLKVKKPPIDKPVG